MSIITRIAYLLIPSRYYCKDGCPKRCRNCGSTKMTITIRARVANVPSEIEYDCAYCHHPLAYEAYGHFDPYWRQVGPAWRWITRRVYK